MAFDAATFVDGFPAATATRGAGMAAAEFARLQYWEYLNLLEVLAGSDASSGVPQVAKGAVAARMTPPLALARDALSDTLVNAFRAAYEGRDGGAGGAFAPAEPFDARMHAAAHALARLAVVVMADFVA